MTPEADTDDDTLYLIPDGWEPIGPCWIDENGLAHCQWRDAQGRVHVEDQ